MRRALMYIGLAAACIAAGGWVIARTMHLSYGHGVYCALGTAATVGCDATPATGPARLASAAVIVICIPLFALAYGSLSGAHLRRRLDSHKADVVAAVQDEMKAARDHVTRTAGELHRRFDQHAELLRATATTPPRRPGPPA